MKTVKQFKPTPHLQMGVLAVALLGSPLLMAADPGWYGGFSLGVSQADIHSNTIQAGLINQGFTNVALETDDAKTGYKVFTGYQLNRTFAVEGGYFDLGEFGYRARTLPWAIQTGDVKMRGLNLDLIGMLPLSEKFSLTGRAGVIRAQTKLRNRGYGPITINPFGERNSDTNWKAGVGLLYDLTNRLAMRLEAERYQFDDVRAYDDDVDMISLGVVYRFAAAAPVAAAPVRASTPPVAALQRPAVAAPAPAPAPTPPPTPAPARVTLTADSAFEFNSYAVSPAGQVELNKLIADLRTVEFDTIRVTGHTDRMGAQAYNLRLSNQRAEAVKDYLVRTGNIPAARISTRGVNGMEPVTSTGQCGSQLSRAQLISCLAPDRRVEVEVVGTRAR